MPTVHKNIIELRGEWFTADGYYVDIAPLTFAIEIREDFDTSKRTYVDAEYGWPLTVQEFGFGRVEISGFPNGDIFQVHPRDAATIRPY